MKILSILALFSLFVTVKGWVAILKPVALSIGAAFAALNLDVDLMPDMQPIAWKKWLSSKEEGKEDTKA